MDEKAKYHLERVIEYFNKGDYAKAIECLLELKTTMERIIGKENPDYAALLNKLGLMYYNKGDYAHAEECYLEAKSFYEKYGKENIDYAALLNNMGLLYYDKGDYAYAEVCYLESKNIYERYGKDNPDYAALLNNMGSLHHYKGYYARAEEYYLEAKYIRERVLSKNHPDYAISLNSLGALYHYNGDYFRAEEYYLEAKYIREKVLGKEHPSYAVSLNNLGGLYHDMGNYARAEKCYLESKNIYERQGKEHPDYATSLNNLGMLYVYMGDYTRGEKCYLESKDIQERVLGKEHPDYATSLNNLGTLYQYKRDYAGAKKFLSESKNIREKVLGKEHPNYSDSLNNLGMLYHEEGDYARAEECYLESKDITERLFGKEHISSITSLENLSKLYWTMEDYKRAIAYKNEVNKQYTNLVIRVFFHLTDRECENYWNANSYIFELSYSLSWFHPVSESNALNYNNALFTKGLLLRTAKAKRAPIHILGNKSLIAQYNEFSYLRQQIGNQLQKEDKNEAYIKNMEEQADKLDKFLTPASDRFKKFQSDLTLNWQDVLDSLQSGEAAIEFVSFKLFDKKWTSATQYAALVLRSNMDAPEWIPLPNCEKTLIEFLKKQDEKFQEQEKTVYDENSFDLYASVWQPLEKSLEGVTTVYYSPSGLLHKISFNAIPIKENLRLTDKYELNIVSSTREIVHRKDKTQQKPGSGVVYGGLQYTMDEEDMKREALPYHKPDAETQEETVLPDKLREGSMIQHWEMLPCMEKEGIDIHEILLKNNIPVDLYMGAKGNKESFLNLKGKKKNVLHLSTHGFFLGDIKMNYEERELLARLGGGHKAFENPLKLSGLLLAGCNNAWKGKPVAGVENGILDAAEVADMDLLGAQLVVLSACKTALGEVNNSEGVFGLQRAFKLAGADTLVMSLWCVSDEATSELMKSFYEKWLSGKSKQEAFKDAQRELRSRPEYSLPFYWAAFVMID